MKSRSLAGLFASVAVAATLGTTAVPVSMSVLAGPHSSGGGASLSGPSRSGASLSLAPGGGASLSAGSRNGASLS